MTTAAASLLTPAQKQQFEADGYCVVPDLFTAAEIAEIEEYFERFKQYNIGLYDPAEPWEEFEAMFAKISAQGSSAFENNRRRFDELDKNKDQVRAMHPHRFSQRVVDWMLNPNVAAVLEDLLSKPALGVQTMYYFKPPGAKGQGMHQDNFYLLAQPATCIAAWTAIDASEIDNGCLYVVPGSHRGDILCPEEGKERWNNYGDSHITTFPRDRKPVPVSVPRGSTMFFGGNLIHGSGPNRTADRSRRTFIGHYVDEATEHLAKFYFPVLNMQGESVTDIAHYAGGGPCGGEWGGGVH